MASIERRVASLEAAARDSAFSHLSDAALDAKIDSLLAAQGSSLDQEIARHGSFHALLVAVQHELRALGFPPHTSPTNGNKK